MLFNKNAHKMCCYYHKIQCSDQGKISSDYRIKVRLPTRNVLLPFKKMLLLSQYFYMVTDLTYLTEEY